MIGLVGRRLLTMVPLLLFVTLVVHGIAIFVAGDPAVRIAGENATAEQIALTRDRLNLDEPWPVRYWRWLTDAVRAISATQSSTRCCSHPPADTCSAPTTWAGTC
ncbi:MULTISPECIES: hypothetical protein [unclassified Solwaraspora]|uniref:hypothetical protein n=1 Tax=unclassified Solwaraspora TaxID=2627926 RepID=UPI00248AE6A3|nr:MULTISPECIES: hypothetical protein [unclassified Solwaraspora]WBB99640.1 hypothetical protein O7553_12525 [Solwaraspora sp. WMMA2059]WBC21810.1 hypothetical protein O7543_04845 [Solwaraspora sp. WMMA2080]WJK36143.1 hypothetical protein O7610_07270 [Solwaraspora sp. WMMA2065]